MTGRSYLSTVFFVLSKILYFLILPFSWITLLAGWSLFTNNPKLKRRLKKVVLAVFMVFSNPWLSHQAMIGLEVSPKELTKTYEAGIVLSGIVASGIHIESQIQLGEGADRIIEAVKLYHDGKIKKILISGGKADIKYPKDDEGLQLVSLATQLGIPSEDIIWENKSRNTYENAQYSAEMLKMNDGEKLLITSSFHMRRAMACFENAGIAVDPYPVDYRVPSNFKWAYLIPSSEAFKTWNIVIKELVGTIVYRMVGYI